jgi:molecular chaperone GrpE (heat shock protein)
MANYIVHLQNELKDANAKLAAMQEEIQNFRRHLQSSKFQNVEGQERNDWIAVADVQRWLDNIVNAEQSS